MSIKQVVNVNDLSNFNNVRQIAQMLGHSIIKH